MEVLDSEKGKTVIVINNYKFRFHKKLANNKERWACTKKTCKAFIKIDEAQNILEAHELHNHEPENHHALLMQKIGGTLKRKAVEDISSKPTKIIHSELRISDNAEITLRDVNAFRRKINYARRSSYPKLPSTADDFHNALDAMDVKSNLGENLLFINSRSDKIVCFTTVTNLKALCEMRRIFVDGTFYSAPKQFTQVFTLHGLHDNVYMPLVFFLLPNKTQQIYEKAFYYLIDICKQNKFMFNPHSIYADFELAIHLAIRQVIPNSQICGCRFHLGQSWYKKIQELGLSTEYNKTGSEIGNILKLFFGLPFLDSSEVDDCFTDDLMSISPQNDKLQKFFDYFLETYLKPTSPFPPKIWAKFSPTITRTTNSCESFHSKFNAMFYCSRPNLFQWLEALKNVQCEIYIKLRSSIKPAKKTLDKERYLRENMLLYKNGSLSRLDFIETMSKMFLPKT